MQVRGGAQTERIPNQISETACSPLKFSNSDIELPQISAEPNPNCLPTEPKSRCSELGSHGGRGSKTENLNFCPVKNLVQGGRAGSPGGGSDPEAPTTASGAVSGPNRCSLTMPSPLKFPVANRWRRGVECDGYFSGEFLEGQTGRHTSLIRL